LDNSCLETRNYSVSTYMLV